MAENNKPTTTSSTPLTQTEPTKKALSITEYAKQDIEKLIAENGLILPDDYAVGNAIQSAYLKLLTVEDMNHQPALAVCDQGSVVRAIRNMIIQGLTVDKNQGYFIVYGKQLSFQRSYFGTIAVSKRFAGVAGEPIAQVVIEGDEVVTEIVNGEERVVSHIRKDRFKRTITRENLLGAYCVVNLKNGGQKWEIMDRTQILAAWNKSKSKQQLVHQEFPDQMAMRSVINRALKILINSSSDAPILVKAFNESGYISDDEVEIDGQSDTLLPESAFSTSISVDEIRNSQNIKEPSKLAEMAQDEAGQNNTEVKKDPF